MYVNEKWEREAAVAISNEEWYKIGELSQRRHLLKVNNCSPNKCTGGNVALWMHMFSETVLR